MRLTELRCAMFLESLSLRAGGVWDCFPILLMPNFNRQYDIGGVYGVFKEATPTKLCYYGVDFLLVS